MYPGTMPLKAMQHKYFAAKGFEVQECDATAVSLLFYSWVQKKFLLTFFPVFYYSMMNVIFHSCKYNNFTAYNFIA